MSDELLARAHRRFDEILQSVTGGDNVTASFHRLLPCQANGQRVSEGIKSAHANARQHERVTAHLERELVAGIGAHEVRVLSDRRIKNDAIAIDLERSGVGDNTPPDRAQQIRASRGRFTWPHVWTIRVSHVDRREVRPTEDEETDWFVQCRTGAGIPISDVLYSPSPLQLRRFGLSPSRNANEADECDGSDGEASNSGCHVNLRVAPVAGSIPRES